MNLLNATTGPIWPTEDPDEPTWPDTNPDDDNRGPFDAYLPVEETTVDAEQTPAQKTADAFTALVDHLRAHPHLSTVNVLADGRAQITARRSDGWNETTALLAWAETLVQLTDVELFCFGTARKVSVELNAGPLRVWTTLPIADDFGLQQGDSRTITFIELYEAIAPAEVTA